MKSIKVSTVVFLLSRWISKTAELSTLLACLELHYHILIPEQERCFLDESITLLEYRENVRKSTMKDGIDNH